MTPRRQLLIGIAVAATLWFYMFSQWTAGITNFWLTMAFSAVVLTTLTLAFTSDRRALLHVEKPLLQIVIGIGIAVALWGVFWVGDKLSAMMFSFARPEVDAVYSMKDGSREWTIALLLLLVVGPAEELFWRGFVQRRWRVLLERRQFRFAADHAFVFTTLVYGLVHVWSFNFKLVMAALVAGAVWGFIYRLKPSLLPALVISHALWDALVFVIFPI